MMSRDDFPKSIVEQVARRAAYVCSLCGRLTSGPHSNDDKSTNCGVAGYITAASPGGPRYDASLTTAERKGIANAIYVCRNCGDPIDKDPDRYTVEVLRRAKSRHEARLATWEYRLPSTESHEALRANQEIARQNTILAKLRRLYCFSHDNISPATLEGLEPCRRSGWRQSLSS
jgi:DNA-directed RNA polymerase subunit RPC12/RpoP